MSSNIPNSSSNAATASMVNPFSGRTVGHDSWLTPRDILSALGPFDLDPATPPDMPWPTATRMLTKNEDGLTTAWLSTEFTFVSPPCGRELRAWMAKTAAHGNGIALVFARTETTAFQRFVWNHPNTTGLFFFRGRLKFCRADGTEAGPAGAPSVLVAYGMEARGRLERAAARGLIRGALVDPPGRGALAAALPKAA